jgi:hypothetical protein
MGFAVTSRPRAMPPSFSTVPTSKRALSPSRHRGRLEPPLLASLPARYMARRVRLRLPELAEHLDSSMTCADVKT